MIIEYLNGEKVVTHPTGIVSRYSQTDIEQHKAGVQENIDRLNALRVSLTVEITDVQNST